MIVFGWLSYLYFPISYDRKHLSPLLFHATVVSVTLLRFIMMYLALINNWAGRASPNLAYESK